MPVGTQASVKGLTQRMLWDELGAGIILANTYHLFLRPGHEVIEELGGLHGFMAWPGAVLTDSGGFQVFSLAGLRKVTEEGVIFRSHLDGSEHVFTPESTVDVQRALGSDVMMVLDECTEYPVSRERARESMETTLRWAERAVRHWRGGELESRGGALFPIVQGSMFVDLRRECTERLVALDAPGYAIGGLSVGEPRGMSYEMVKASEPLLPRDKPRYVMGVGMLAELGEYVALGVDMMDCVLPTRNARNGYLFTADGPVRIKNAQWARDGRALDESCECYTCRNFSRGYLRHLFLAREMLFGTLATLHNVFTYLDRMKRIREAIVLGHLPEYLAVIRAKEGERS